MLRKWLTVAVLAALGFLCSSAEVWMEAGKFYWSPGETAHISVKEGSDFLGSAWQEKDAAFQRLEMHTASQVYDLKTAVKEPSEPFDVRLAGEGSHVIAAETMRTFSEMDGETFTAYLRSEGLDDIYYQREKAGISGESATQFLSHYSKLILQAGARLDDTYKKNCHHPLEIIPEKNPAAMKKGDPIRFKILYQGKPLFGAKVKVWNRYNHRTSVQNIYSQQDGMIETHVSNPGAWMVSVVTMIPSRDPHARYRSFWATLVFGVR